MNKAIGKKIRWYSEYLIVNKRKTMNNESWTEDI